MRRKKKSINIQELHKYFYECLKYFDAFCSVNKLNYVIMWGTLLGCVRDGGIIPWDGDVDLVMPYYDYERLIGLKNKFDNDKYELTFPAIDTRTSSNEVRIKINNVFWHQKQQKGSYDRRVAIDIFVATPLSINEKENYKSIKDYSETSRKLYLKYDSFGHENFIKKIIHSFISFFMIFINGKKLHDKLSEIEKRFIKCDQNNKWFCPQAFMEGVVRFPKEFLTNYKRKSFGSIVVNCPTDYKDVLEQTYGSNWKTPIRRDAKDFESYFVIDTNSD